MKDKIFGVLQRVGRCLPPVLTEPNTARNVPRA